MTELPEGKFGAILADPPWRFETWDKPWEWTDADGRRKTSRNADGHYGTGETQDIARLPVAACAAPSGVHAG